MAFSARITRPTATISGRPKRGRPLCGDQMVDAASGPVGGASRPGVVSSLKCRAADGVLQKYTDCGASNLARSLRDSSGGSHGLLRGRPDERRSSVKVFWWPAPPSLQPSPRGRGGKNSLALWERVGLMAHWAMTEVCRQSDRSTWRPAPKASVMRGSQWSMPLRKCWKKQGWLVSIGVVSAAVVEFGAVDLH